MEKIDFVIPWLNDEDPQWKATKANWLEASLNQYSCAEDANGVFRYRSDSELLRYWFRSVEAFAPWVNRIHFVTCGQRPLWLNENHPKLSLVNHSDFIPEKYLPTFNTSSIEMNFHRIRNLSEQFVYFNDDVFLLRPVDITYFFKSQCPVLIANLRYPADIGYNNWSRQVFNDYCLINESFDVGQSIWENRKKWFSLSALGYKRARRNFFCYIANKSLPVSSFGHLAHPHLKSTFEEIWNHCLDVLDVSCSHKFRADDQVNQWLAIAWNLAKGRFFPAHENERGRIWNISPNNINQINESIRQQLCPQVCLNDSQYNSEPEQCSKVIIEAFESILPTKSEFETD